ncbi:S8 family serine peptidase [Halosolutus amylolyticus]|uniref:S8 family serine peptidase n=1 Tax=Halosolutus amylolyticus TaxID=2932267 RepID=A0ABD5PPP0_9EURY|nr:S8 family serine peptidase [Halosolutus amylolyticus]
MTARAPLSDPLPDSRNRGRVVLVVSLLLATALAGLPIAGGVAIDDAAGPSTDASIQTGDGTGGVVDEGLSDDGSIEVVVRLEDPDIPASLSGSEAESKLESHANETQGPLLAHAETTAGVTVEEELWLTNAVVLTVDTDRADLEPIAALDAVERVHENFAVSIPERQSATNASPAGGPGSGTTTGRTWGLDYLNVPAVWETYETRGEGVRVAVLDTGVDATHPDIDLYTEDPSDPTYPGGWAEFDETGVRVPGSTPYDSDSHGTHVSGTVAGGNASGTRIGVAPGVDLLHGLVLPDTGGSFAQVVAGMEWAVANDADVASMSLGTAGKHPAFIEPVQNARDSGTIVVGAIGNDGHGTSSSPGNVDETLAVGAVAPDGTVPAFSGGERIDRSDWAVTPATWPATYVAPDVVAPGVAVTSAVPGGEYARLPGTSMATPHVTGTVALLLSVEPGATLAEIESALTDSASIPAVASDLETTVDPETRYGLGVVDARDATDALVEARGGTDPVPLGERSDADHPSEPNGTGPNTAGPIVLVAAIGFVAFLVTLALARARNR